MHDVIVSMFSRTVHHMWHHISLEAASSMGWDRRAAVRSHGHIALHIFTFSSGIYVRVYEQLVKQCCVSLIPSCAAACCLLEP